MRRAARNPSRIAYRPEQRRDKRDAIQHNPAAAVDENQDRGNHHYHAHDQEVSTSAYGDEFKTQPANGQTDDRHQSGKEPLQDTGYPTARCQMPSLSP